MEIVCEVSLTTDGHCVVLRELDSGVEQEMTFQELREATAYQLGARNALELAGLDVRDAFTATL